MLDLDDRVNRVYNPDVRPLVQEAHRCYSSGSARGAIVLVWTAVCADLITKAQTLKEDGEAAATNLVAEVEKAQQSKEEQAIPIMLGVERTLLDTAETLELIDHTQKKQLERLRDDRNMCAHPSLRPLGELYEPTMEYARAHLAAALEAVLIHPPSQGRKVIDSFSAHVADPSYAFDATYLAYAFFDRVRPSARAKVVEFAAKFAILAIDAPELSITPEKYADRMADCLRCFAERDADLAKAAVAKQMARLEKADPGVQLRALGRLGDLPAFWASVADPVRALFNTRIEAIGEKQLLGRMNEDKVNVIALVTHPEIREGLPALAPAFQALNTSCTTQVIAARPDPYFVPSLPDLLKQAGSFDAGEFIAASAVLPCAAFLDLEQLRAVLREWQDNNQCWGRAMPSYLIDFHRLTAHLGPERDEVWQAFLAELLPFDDLYQTISTGIGLTADRPETDS
ncbi:MULTISPECIES: hypothetical protein [unclassified Streptomyces]|uniref:hypothetical protein n=1 Tax=unclassified Streptomyces TaxID=2593676 RepID=UPI002E0EC8EE|nr:hypothetical protein OG466_40610 [Streptomyces sp. NBC_01240]